MLCWPPGPVGVDRDGDGDFMMMFDEYVNEVLLPSESTRMQARTAGPEHPKWFAIR